MFSAVTVALSVLALVAFPMMFLRSIAYACVGVILLVTMCAILVLPAILRLVGSRIDSLSVGRAQLIGRHAPIELQPPDSGFWFRSSRLVMHRPVAMGGAVLLIALVLAAPFAGIRLNFPDDRSLPTSIESRSVGDAVRSEFSSQASASMDVIVEEAVSADQLDAYAAALSELPHVVTVETGGASYEPGRHGTGFRSPRFVGPSHVG